MNFYKNEPYYPSLVRRERRHRLMVLALTAGACIGLGICLGSIIMVIIAGQ